MSSIQYTHDPVYHNTKAAREVVPFLVEHLKPQSIIDVGCGTGTWLSVFLDHGISDLQGIDGVFVSDENIEVPRQYIEQYDLSEAFELNRKFDLAICLEVAEHLPEASADTLVRSLSGLSNTILFSAAIPGQGGLNHINEQWFSYWQEKFLSFGFVAYDIIRPVFWDNSNVDWWYRQNMFLLVKTDAAIAYGSPKPILNTVHPELYLERLELIRRTESGHIGFWQAIHYLKKAFWFSLRKRLKSR